MFFERAETYRGATLRDFWEGYLLPDHPRLPVKGYVWWESDFGSGEFWATLKSLTPS